jgi:DNA-nicking Smr family endonuclease
MGKKRKRRTGQGAEPSAQAETVAATPAPGIALSIGPLLQRAGLHKLAQEPRPKTLQPPGPSRASIVPEPRSSTVPTALAPLPMHKDVPLAPGELTALSTAYRGVEPIRRPKRGRAARVAPLPPAGPSETDAQEQAARARLSALVAGGVRFQVVWDDGLVEGLRAGVSDKLLRRLGGSGFEPERTLDLHGMRRAQAQKAVQDFVRAERRSGARHLLVIVGKGQHSEGGVGVLAEALVEALTRGVAAPQIAAFASAHARHGGRGAIAILLG